MQKYNTKDFKEPIHGSNCNSRLPDNDIILHMNGTNTTTKSTMLDFKNSIIISTSLKKFLCLISNYFCFPLDLYK